VLALFNSRIIFTGSMHDGLMCLDLIITEQALINKASLLTEVQVDMKQENMTDL
jgi:hypothetical protein